MRKGRGGRGQTVTVAVMDAMDRMNGMNRMGPAHADGVLFVFGEESSCEQRPHSDCTCDTTKLREGICTVAPSVPLWMPHRAQTKQKLAPHVCGGP